MPNTHSILCIDDEDGILNSLKRLFRKDHYNIFLANTGEEGLNILHNEKIDVILCDQKMPTMNGFEVLRAARKNYPDIMRIMISGYSDFESLVKTINEGEIFRFIQKPWDNDDLKETVKIAIEQKEITRRVKTLLSNSQNIKNIIKDFSIETSQDQKTIHVKIDSSEQPYTPYAITNLITFLFESLGLAEDQKVKILTSSISKEDTSIKINIALGKGVKLILEINTAELDK